MKKLLIILMALGINAIGQTNVTTIWYSSADTVTIGDSAWVEIYESHGLILNPYIDTMSLSLDGKQLAKYCYSQLDTMPKVSTIHGMLNKLKFVIPLTTSLGPQLYVEGCNDCFPGGHTKSVFVKGIMIDGINEYNYTDRLISTEYYNIYGEKITDLTGIVVEVKVYASGNRVSRKTIYL
jgi:hypothetical protein